MKKISTLWSLALLLLALGYSQQANADTWIVAGDPAEVFNGYSWAPAAEVNAMTLQGDGTYKFEKNDVKILTESIAFKVTKNGSWEGAYPSDNYIITLQGTGIYDVVITFDPESKTVNGTATLKQTVEEYPDIIICGSPSLFGSNWGNTDTNNRMEQLGNGLYTKTYTHVALDANVEYKYVIGGSWEGDYPQGISTKNRVLYIDEPGYYDVTFGYSLSDKETEATAKKVGELQDEDPSLFILGEANGNGWDPSVGVAMVYKDNKFTAEDVTFKGESDEGVSFFSFTKKLAGNSDDWSAIENYRYDAVTEDGSDFWVLPEQYGQELSLTKGTVAFRIEAGVYKLVADLTSLNLVITKTGEISDNPNAIATVEVETQNTVYYNLQGQRVAAPNKGVYICNGRKVILK